MHRSVLDASEKAPGTGVADPSSTPGKRARYDPNIHNVKNGKVREAKTAKDQPKFDIAASMFNDTATGNYHLQCKTIWPEAKVFMQALLEAKVLLESNKTGTSTWKGEFHKINIRTWEHFEVLFWLFLKHAPNSAKILGLTTPDKCKPDTVIVYKTYSVTIVHCKLIDGAATKYGVYLGGDLYILQKNLDALGYTYEKSVGGQPGYIKYAEEGAENVDVTPLIKEVTKFGFNYFDTDGDDMTITREPPTPDTASAAASSSDGAP